jgi:AcrR family transcriptional regulator
MKLPPLDSRAEQTRSLLLRTFAELVFRNGFENISVQGIATAAGVARSTFYEHFSGKEDVLRASMAQFFSVIAQCVSNETEPRHLGNVLAHMWENRRLTDAIFSGAPRKIIAQSLGEMIEARLHELHDGKPLTLPYRLAAIHIAEAQLALIENWLRGRAFARVEQMCATLSRSARASALALIAEGSSR